MNWGKVQPKGTGLLRMGYLAFGISTTGYFERHNNIYDVSEI